MLHLSEQILALQQRMAQLPNMRVCMQAKDLPAYRIWAGISSCHDNICAK